MKVTESFTINKNLKFSLILKSWFSFLYFLFRY